MKLTIPKIYSKQFLPLSILFVLALIIWFGGPLITIGNTAPFFQPERRFFLITVFFIAWFIKFLFFDADPNIKSVTAPAVSPEIEKKIQTLQGRFQGAIQFLKKTLITKQGKNLSLHQLPWFLLMGTTGSGKTTFLANSNVNFILAKQFKQENLKNISLSNHCDWWATSDLVFVDVPGNYISSKETTLWDSLLDLVKKNRRQTLSGVVITLHLPELLKKNNQQQKKQILNEIKPRIIQLREKFGHQLPFYLVITKCDFLPGFIEFFSDCGSDELNQAWGITIPAIKDNEKLHEVFSHRFNALIKRLNKQLLWRLHQERNPNARPNIKDFPLHVERLKEGIAHFLKALMIPQLRLQGVYLTSAIQTSQDETSQQTNTTINPNASQALQLARAPAMPTHAYFVRQFVLQGLLGSAETPNTLPAKDLWQRRAVYATAVAAVITAAILLGRDFQKSIEQVYSLQNDLTQYQLYIQQATQEENHLAKALPLLNALRDAASHSNYSLSRFVNVLSFYSHKSQQTANAVYAQALQTIVLPEIKNSLEKFLQAPADKNSEHLYMALKAYLMLGDIQNLQPDYIAHTLKKLVPNTLNEQGTEKLTDHINALFSQSYQPAELDTNLIEQIRRQLNGLSTTELGFVILKNMGNNNQENTLNLGTNLGSPPVFTSNQVSNQIPAMYTANAFQPILTTDIVVAATEALQGNWILGASSVVSNQAALTSLIEQLRTQYTANYVDVWESLIANIKLFDPKNLAEMDAMVANLTSSTSPLLQLLQTIQQNTSFAPIATSSPKFQTLNSLLVGNGQQNALYPVFVNLRQLDFYLQTILHSTELGKSTFEATRNRFNAMSDPISQLRVIAEQNPEPMKSWLNLIATQTWKLMLQETAAYINTNWQRNVSSVYRSQFLNHYPFDQNATQDVDLQQFISFMGQPGTLTTFYQTYLKPFVNENEKKWQWKIFDNQKIPLTDIVLDQIQRSALIQHAFFPNGDNKLYVQFSLEPVNLDARTKNFNLNINGQQITYQKERIPRIVSWPGINNLHSTTVNFITPNNQLVTNVLKGDWSWFRLVAQSTRQIISPKQILLDISVNGHTAKYMLYTQGHTNPFLPLNLLRFDLPDQLII